MRLVLSFLDDIDLRTLSSVNSRLYEKVQYVKHHTTVINIGQRSQTSSQLHVLELNHLQSAVRIIKLSGKSYTQEEEPILVHLAHFMSDMNGLQDLHWSCSGSFPHVLRDRLPPQTRLHISIHGFGGIDHHVLESFKALVGNQNLFSLSVYLGIRQVNMICLEKMRALKDLLLSRPRLARVTLLFVGFITTDCI